MDFVRPIEAIVPGAQGRILEVLVNVTAELSLRTIARLADVSPAQASRVLPKLVELGIVERREVPPSALFRLVPEHVATRALTLLSQSAEATMNEMSRLSAQLPILPVSVIIFGSFAQRSADKSSDIDIVFIRPDHLDSEDDEWVGSVEGWRQHVQRITGNMVEIIDIGFAEAFTKLRGDSQLWQDIRREGRVAYGLTIDELIG